MRTCEQCGASIADRYQNARSCRACTAGRNAAAKAAYAARNPARASAAKAAYKARARATRGPSLCRACGADVGLRSRRHCVTCAPARRRETRRANKARAALESQRRRARVLGAPGIGLTHVQWSEVLALHDRRCAYCLRADVPLAVDHVVALVRGGAHDPDNIVPAYKSCNSRKSTGPVWAILTRQPPPSSPRRAPAPLAPAG